ncbi:MAG: helix-turn-helix transcriptional regulator [Rhodospirillales bacterium]
MPFVTTPPAFLTTKELADLLRVKERKVYDLAAAGEVPCRRVTGKLLFPRTEIEAWIAGEAGSLGVLPADGEGSEPSALPAIVAGSHDPLLDWALREAGSGLASFFDGSLDGLVRVKARQALLAGTHVFEAAGRWNLDHFQADFAALPTVALHWAGRSQGMILPPGTRVADFGALAGKRLVLRQETAGSHILFQHFAAEAGLQPSAYETVEVVRTETEAAEAVASGRAEAALGLEAAARSFGLAFQPLIQETFDLLLWQRAYFEPPLQALWHFCAGRAFRDKAAELGGYDLSGHGQVRWIGG